MKSSRSLLQPPVGLALVAALLVGFGLRSAPAQEAATLTNTAPPKIPWETSAAAGLTLTKGNSDTLLVTLGLDTKRKWERNEAAFGIAGGYGQNDSVKNNEFLTAFGQYNRLFSDRFYGGLRVDANYDGIANLDYRVTITPLAGYYLVKATNTTLVVEVGPSAVFEQYKDQSATSYLGIRFGERFEQKLSATTKFWESLSYVPQIDRWTEKYIVTGEMGIDTAMTKKWSLRVVFQDIYDSEPASGRDNNDLRLVAGTAYKF